MPRLTKAGLQAVIDGPYRVLADGETLPAEYVWTDWWARQSAERLVGYTDTFSFSDAIDGGDQASAGAVLEGGDETTTTEPVIGGFPKMEND